MKIKVRCGAAISRDFRYWLSERHTQDCMTHRGESLWSFEDRVSWTAFEENKGGVPAQKLLRLCIWREHGILLEGPWKASTLPC